MQTTRRNEGGRYSAKGASDWYNVYAEQRIAELEAAQRTAEMAEQALAAALAKQVGNAVSAMPEAASRITKAAAIVQRKDVFPLASGNFLVGSQTDPLAAHLVVRAWAWECDCLHMQHRQSLCSHAIAAMLTVKLGARYQANYTMPAAA